MTTAAVEVVYPVSDGEPMADNMRQALWMTRLLGNLDALLDCFVGCNNFWFPVEGEPEVRLAPDVYVAFGRPKGDRASYMQWKEDDTPVTVVFEIWSPGNNTGDMEEKYTFYTDHGVEEFYIYDPYRHTLEIYLRRGTALRRHWQTNGFVSPRMGIRFDLTGGEMVIYRPDGRPFLTIAEIDEERRRVEAALQQSKALVARLAELSRKARRGLASADELAELDRLEGDAP